MIGSVKKKVIFGESNTDNAVFYDVIRKFLMISSGRLTFNRSNYLETSFSVCENKYMLISTSSVLFSHRNDNEVSKAEGILNQQLLLSSDVIYLFINTDNADLDYNLSIQKYFNQNNKKHLVIFNSDCLSRNEFESDFLTSIPAQRIIKNSGGTYFFFSLKNNYIPQLQQFIYSEFSLSNDLDKVVVSFEQGTTPKLTIFGPPNSGKSTLLNSLLGRERSIVSSIAGTTRENVTSLFGWKEITLEIKDTEGILFNRRNDYSILSNCQISWVVLDSTEPITKKTLQIISLAEKCNRAIVIIFNKVDIASIQQIDARKEEINLRLKSFSFVPVVFISAQKRNNLSHLLAILEHAIDQSQLTFSKALLAQQFSKLLEKNPPAAIRGKHLKIYYALHEKGFVHKFVVFVNNPQLVHFSYHRYIINYLRRNLGIDSLPIRLFFKKS